MFLKATGQKIRWFGFDFWWSLIKWWGFLSFLEGMVKSFKLLKCLIMYKVGINSTWAIRRQIVFRKRKCNVFSEEIPGDALPKNQVIWKHSKSLCPTVKFNISFHSFFFSFLHQTWNSGLCISEFSDKKALLCPLICIKLELIATADTCHFI